MYREIMTPKRLAITLITLLICLELFFAANLFQEIILGQTPFLDNHHDFLAFYSAGYLTSHGQVDKIYDPATISSLQYSIVHQSVGAAGFMAYVNPPAIAVLLAPLGLF